MQSAGFCLFYIVFVLNKEDIVPLFNVINGGHMTKQLNSSVEYAVMKAYRGPEGQRGRSGMTYPGSGLEEGLTSAISESRTASALV